MVEDEVSLADTVRYNLEREGYAVAVATDGRQALERFRDERPGLVILDLMLPEISGLDVCRQIRQMSNVPIVMVTAKDSEADKVAGPGDRRRRLRDQAVLDPGADLPGAGPSPPRRHARGRAVGGRLAGGPVELDVARHEVQVRGETVGFPPKEFELLETFLRRKGRLLTRDFLIEEVWGAGYFGDTKTLDVHVKRIRRKVEEDPTNPPTS